MYRDRRSLYFSLNWYVFDLFLLIVNCLLLESPTEQTWFVRSIPNHICKSERKRNNQIFFVKLLSNTALEYHRFPPGAVNSWWWSRRRSPSSWWQRIGCALCNLPRWHRTRDDAGATGRILTPKNWRGASASQIYLAISTDLEGADTLFLKLLARRSCYR